MVRLSGGGEDTPLWVKVAALPQGLFQGVGAGTVWSCKTDEKPVGAKHRRSGLETVGLWMSLLAGNKRNGGLYRGVSEPKCGDDLPLLVKPGPGSGLHNHHDGTGGVRIPVYVIRRADQLIKER